MRILSWTLSVVLIGVLIYLLKDCKGPLSPAPAGIHGTYRLSDYDPIYKTNLDKDTLLRELEREGLVIKSGRLHDYDPPWDSLRFLIDNIMCDTQKIEPYIEFDKERKSGFTSFRILWINAQSNESDDPALYRILTMKYYNCFEAILKQHGVRY